jgi:hypothetical protein
MERGKSKGFANSIGDWMNATATDAVVAGSTNAIEVSSERSESSRPSFRPCHARSPYDSLEWRELSDDDARQSGTARRCSTRIDTMPMQFPRVAHKAERQRASRCLHRSNVADFDVPFASRSRSNSIARHYSVTRHSLQARQVAASRPTHSTLVTSRFCGRPADSTVAFGTFAALAVLT